LKEKRSVKSMGYKNGLKFFLALKPLPVKGFQVAKGGSLDFPLFLH